MTKIIGAIHLIITVNNFSLLNCPSDDLTSSEITFGPTTNPIRIHVSSATIGMITLLLIKSKVSRIDMFPKNVMSLHALKPNADGIPIAKQKIVTTIHVKVLFQWNLSQRIETIVSINEIEEVSAAKNTNMKKSVPIAPPNAMLLNTFGNVMNIRLGPACKFSAVPPENANTPGTTISPAMNAIPVSKISI